ncbi:MAG: helix-turn-helix domain-containing protein [Terriglobales bacterium]
MKLQLTQEEIAQMLGLSRETVSRVFADFRKQRLIRQNGATLVIPDRVALKSLIDRRRAEAGHAHRLRPS